MAVHLVPGRLVLVHQVDGLSDEARIGGEAQGARRQGPLSTARVSGEGRPEAALGGPVLQPPLDGRGADHPVADAVGPDDFGDARGLFGAAESPGITQINILPDDAPAEAQVHNRLGRHPLPLAPVRHGIEG